ncbi:hypothetical protein [Limimaricola cinnabarinus]|jgi:hypothetical protein|uniref:Phasin domain-containing protein n=1 Tax=Limimaricola cinnabarinus LL-001 TaxID=1337093 RepID=U3AIA8_9RHOB|nr:hypothetical protein [Limimaricola cinnabarinus]GAD57404.1 hypothetical protein MBELCI_3456 [Limimaricola cinnabarinus LL-001]
MTRTPRLKPATADRRPSTRAVAPRSFPTLRHEHLWAAQVRLLNETETFLAGWFERRHHMAEALGEFAAETSEAGTDTARLSQAVTRWQEGAQTRLRADLRDWLILCTNCTGHLAREAHEAESEMLDTTVELTRRARTAQHATPV